jgi:hypothetical protein
MGTVYEYKGVSYELPDGLSNEAALSKIKSSLGEVQPTPQEPAQQVAQQQQKAAKRLIALGMDQVKAYEMVKDAKMRADKYIDIII